MVCLKVLNFLVNHTSLIAWLTVSNPTDKYWYQTLLGNVTSVINYLSTKCWSFQRVLLEFSAILHVWPFQWHLSFCKTYNKVIEANHLSSLMVSVSWRTLLWWLISNWILFSFLFCNTVTINIPFPQLSPRFLYQERGGGGLNDCEARLGPPLPPSPHTRVFFTRREEKEGELKDSTQLPLMSPVCRH